jgi:hypothetical protein
MTGEVSPPCFAGDLFLRLASEGRLKLDPAQAGRFIARLECTLLTVHFRLRTMQLLQSLRGREVNELPDGVVQQVVDVMLLDRLQPGTMAKAATEIPKYIEALRQASGAEARYPKETKHPCG